MAVPNGFQGMAMKKAILMLAILLLSTSSEAQWHQIAKFMSTDDNGDPYVEPIGLIYFINSQIGFEAGIPYGELWRTTDGGITWNQCWSHDKYGDAGIMSMCFMDSVNGWFSCGASAGWPVCWHTTDAGNSWFPQYVQFPTYAGSAGLGGTINYSPFSNRVFLSLYFDSLPSRALGPAGDRLVVSSDYGASWQFVPGFDSLVHVFNSYLDDTQEIYYKEFGPMSFWSDSQGMVSSNYPVADSNGDWSYGPGPYFRTTDGGLTWVQAGSLPDGSAPPWAIPGSSICFTTTFDNVYRSDDYGQTWRVLYTLPRDSLGNGPICYGINGDLNHLIINTDSSLFLSSDEGMTWVNGGIHYDSMDVGWWNDTPYYDYYAAIYSGGVYVNGKIFAGKTGEGSEGLWEEDWPQAAGVAEPPSAASSNDLRVFPNPAGSTLQILSGPSGTARLFDLLGREVLEAPVSAGLEAPAHTLDVSRLLTGTYFLRLGGESAKVVIAR